MEVKLHIDKQPYKAKPSGGELAGIKVRVQRAPPVDITLESLIKRIEAGCSISPAVMTGMSAADWTEQQLFLVDIDNDKKETPILAIKSALALCNKNNIQPVFTYRTFSDSEEKPKYRLAFVMDESITDPSQRKIIMKALVSLFPQSDGACVNADRIFFGTDKAVSINDLDARISMKDIYGVYNPTTNDIGAYTHNRPSKEDDMSELAKLKRNFDFLHLLKQRNGEYKITDYGAVFKNCEICDHHDNLVYYRETNSFYCFSSSGQIGGSIIDYLMAADNLSLKTS